MCKKCSVEGCENKHCAKGYCGKHYNQMKRYGHILERTKYDANEIVEYEDHAEIVLYDSEGKEIARTLIDLEYTDLVKKYKWHLTHGYVFSHNFGFLHRLIMNPTDDLVIDHINHNPLDNRRCNLRICKQQENIMNKSIQSNNTSGVTGICWIKNRNKWLAQIYVNKKNKFLGYFNTKEEAIEARRQAEIIYFGEYTPNKD